MKKNLILILIKNRSKSAEKVQAILTEYGCIIKTRLGLHDDVLDKCSNSGLIILELVGSQNEHNDLKNKLAKIENISVELVSLAI